MSRSLSPIHRPLDPAIADIVDSPPPPPPTRISRLAALDSRKLAGTVRSLGPGGASAVYEQAVRNALVDEMADQLRAQGQIGQWAAEIIAAFREG